MGFPSGLIEWIFGTIVATPLVDNSTITNVNPMMGKQPTQRNVKMVTFGHKWAPRGQKRQFRSHVVQYVAGVPLRQTVSFNAQLYVSVV